MSNLATFDRRRSRWFIASAFIAMFSAAVSQVAADSSAGFSSTPPAEGPQIKAEQGYLVPYTATIPGSNVTFEMVPIPGGKFTLGSPASEVGGKADEGPQAEIEVAPFWMGKFEITWAEYRHYMKLTDIFVSFKNAGVRPIVASNEADAVSAPSNLYMPEFTFAKGDKPKLPAVTMSQFAAKQYTKWLSKLTGQTYRLPSEAEWEYACRAGTSTAYSFGDDPKLLADYGWCFDNSDDAPHEVGLKKPNPWGLYDMHGNAAEWVLDEYSADGYQQLAGKTTAKDAVAWPTKLFPRVLRGGSWDDDPASLRSAARRPSDDDQLRTTDPNLPKSPRRFTEVNALGIGFRIIRPLMPLSKVEQDRVWEADVELIRRDVKFRVENEGRGARGIVDPALPDEIQKRIAK